MTLTKEFRRELETNNLPYNEAAKELIKGLEAILERDLTIEEQKDIAKHLALALKNVRELADATVELHQIDAMVGSIMMESMVFSYIQVLDKKSRLQFILSLLKRMGADVVEVPHILSSDIPLIEGGGS